MNDIPLPSGRASLLSWRAFGQGLADCLACYAGAI